MTAALTVTPASQTVSEYVTVAGTGGGAYQNRIKLDGVVVYGQCSGTTVSAALQVGSAVTTQTFTWEQLISGTWTSVATKTVSVVAGGGGVIAQFPGGGPSTSAALKAMMENTGIDVIEIAAGTYTGFHVFVGADRGASHPLIVRPKAGAAVVFDGAGSSDGLFYFGSFIGLPNGHASYMTVDAAGTGGSFSAINYHLGATGFVCTGWASHIAVNGFTCPSGFTGLAPGMTSHFVYVSTDGVHRSDHVTFNTWNVTGDASHYLNALQVYGHNVPFGCDGVTAHSWTVTSCNYWDVLQSDSTLIDIDGWNGTSCSHTIYAQGTETGTVKNCNGHGSCGALAVGSDGWINTGITNGGGNTP